MVIQYTTFQYQLINPTASAMGLFYFDSAEFIRWPLTLGTPEGQLEQPQATGTEPQTLLGTVFPLQGGAREGLFCRVRVCFCRVRIC